jgi:hypothetical protein
VYKPVSSEGRAGELALGPKRADQGSRGQANGRKERREVRTGLETARKYRGESLTSIAHHIGVEWLYCAFELVRRVGARGIDGVGAEEYELNLWENLTNLLDRFKSGTYRAPAVKRVYIPKAGSTEKRPSLGIPTYEDKIL